MRSGCVWSISIAPWYERWWKAFMALTASSPRGLYPKIRSIHRCRLRDTYSDSSAWKVGQSRTE